MTTINPSGNNIWATAANQALRNHTDYADTFHAVFNGITMNGGAGADTFHIKAGTTGSTIEHFSFTQGDKIKIDGLASLDPNKFSVTVENDNYVVAYGAEGEADYTTFSFWRPVDDSGTPLTISADQFKAKFLENVELGGLDPFAEYATGFESIALAKLANTTVKTFEITGERPLYIEGFSASKNRHNLVFSANLAGTGPLYVTKDIENNTVSIRRNDKLLAQMTPPEGTTSIETWMKNTIFEIRSAAKQAGLQISNR